MSLNPITRGRGWLTATLVALVVMAWVAGCDDGTVIGPEESALPLILSDTSAQAAVPPPETSISQEPKRLSLSAASEAPAATNVAYISLPPGAVPNGLTTIIRNRATGSTIVVPMVGGGFDPVAIEATAGDILGLEIQVAGGSAPLLLERVV